MTPQPGPAGSIGLVAVTAAGRRHAAALARAWPDARLVEGDSGAAALTQAWASCDAVVAFLATGAVIRILAPLLGDKRSDPAMVVVDEAATHAIALLGGHAGGANALAEQVGAALGARPVISTATDAVGLPGLDTLGWPVEGAVAAVSRAILDGSAVDLIADQTWPLPSLGVNPGPDGSAAAHRLLVTDRVVPYDQDAAVLRPPSLVIGVGSSRGVDADEVLALIDGVLVAAQLSAACVASLATVDLKADEAGIVDAAKALGVPLVTYPAAVLAAVTVPTPSEVVRAVIGTPSVAEAAALLSDRRDAVGELVVTKTASTMATVAVARHRPRGRLAIVGLGPGARDLLTPRAVTELRRASVVVGLDQYVDQIRDLLRPGTRILATGLGQEEARAHAAVDEARAGHAVALIGSGDAGVYAMASPALEYAGPDIDVVGVPGVTAGLAASAVLGAPLGHDHSYISLSDLHTPWEVILRRVRAAAEGDVAVLFYNPRSRNRHWQLSAALAVLAEHRPPGTPVGVVRNASRDDENAHLATLASFDPDVVDMYSLVMVGSSSTRIIAGRMVTPRGYLWQS
jgi:cobalt-precorrin 5A hydrolase/precorrin-3B C17-methyltransferase